MKVNRAVKKLICSTTSAAASIVGFAKKCKYRRAPWWKRNAAKLKEAWTRLAVASQHLNEHITDKHTIEFQNACENFDQLVEVEVTYSCVSTTR